jgi:hypothetical protein
MKAELAAGGLAVAPSPEWTSGEVASPHATPRRDGVTPLGDQLRAARERRGVELDQVSTATRIRTTYLEALERHHWEVLPADVFTRGYVRSYAEYLGLDPEHLLKLYARERRVAGADASSPSEPDAARAFLERLAKDAGRRGPADPERGSSGWRWAWAEARSWRWPFWTLPSLLRPPSRRHRGRSGTLRSSPRRLPRLPPSDPLRWSRSSRWSRRA